MFRNVFDGDERAQVGIGTLIVFIAMVLVAAIAAGVLLNTAGLLETQAMATGEESTRQVTNNLQVISEVGYNVAGDSDVGDGQLYEPREDGSDLAIDAEKLYQVRMVVQKAAGASDINVSKSTIEYFGAEATTLTYYDDNEEIIYKNNGTFNVDNDGKTLDSSQEDVFLTYNVRGGKQVLSKDDDRVGVIILLGTYDTSTDFVSGSGELKQPAPLGVGEDIRLRFTTPAGAQRFVALQTPKNFGEDVAVGL
jgi:flagellin FlaB